ncbi:MAG: hypothetical protein CVV03_11705 [Firmicutes bacterium HGW-Firmicutes-8]|nr:MAG: hypothetical protein CVV03_11705 [Firmicutes bacterium HGW-Firmicutes-8]
MLTRMVLAFITSMFTGITLRTPASAWLAVGVTGMLGWGASEAVGSRHVPELFTAVTAAFVVGTIGEIMARIQKHPVTVYIVSGIIPLVPGITAYNSMLEFLQKDFNQGLFLAFRAFLVATYLAAGLAVAPLIVRSTRSLFSRRRKKIDN